jgi:LPXTG-motif cell wall-anchored protein
MQSGFRRVSRGRALVVATAGMVAVAVGGLGLAGPASAAATVFQNVQCHGMLGTTQLPDSLIPTRDFTVNVSMPTEVNAGSQFTVTFPGGSTDLPAGTDPGQPGNLPITGYTDLSTSYALVGANFVSGSAVPSGPPTNNGNTKTGTVVISGGAVTFGTPGPLDPGTLVSPTITVKATAGAAGSTITIHAGAVLTTVAVAGLGNIALTCPIPDDTLATTQVVTPPPPGAPNAVADVATTDQGEAVTVDVLNNDTPNLDVAIDEDSLAITTDPAHGTATVNADHTITYTPNAGFSGDDSFDYQLCSQVPTEITQPIPQQVEAACDTATVTVTVVAPAPPTTEGTTATTAAPVTVTATELPRTGSSSTPLALMGFGLLVAGLAATGFARTRRKGTARRQQ